MPSRLLRVAALVEFVSLCLLLANLATVHWPEAASLLGPIHGCAYLFVIGSTVHECRAASTRLLAIVPGVGGFLVIHRIRGAGAVDDKTWAMAARLARPSDHGVSYKSGGR
jgi:hypothetical protein